MTGNYATIKELVIEAYLSENNMPEYEVLTALVKRHFPKSKWKMSHYSWYKSKIKLGQFSVSDRESPTLEDEPRNEAELESEVEESIDTRVSLERDLHDYLGRRLEKIESGLKIHPNGIEYVTDAGRIDILAVDSNGRFVVIEVKAGQARDAALGQLLGYIGCLSKMNLTNQGIRGILVAADFDPRVIYACAALPNIQTFKYRMNFEFGEVK